VVRKKAKARPRERRKPARPAAAEAAAAAAPVAPPGADARLRILFVEDRPADVELSRIELRRAGIDAAIDVVATLPDLRARLRDHRYDVVLSDYSLEGFTGMDAFDAVRASGREVPFLLVTGSLGDEAAVDCLKRGVDNYVTKDRLTRLPRAVRQAIDQDAAGRREAEAVAALRESEERLRQITENIEEVYGLFTADGAQALYVNRAYETLFGRSCASLYEEPASFLQTLHPDDRPRMVAELKEIRRGAGGRPFEVRVVRPDGQVRWVLARAVGIQDARGTVHRIAGVAADITDRKRAEDDLAFTNVVLSTQQETSLDAILVVDEDGRILSYNQHFVELWGIPAELVARRSDPEVLQAATDRTRDPAAFRARVDHLYEHREEESQEEFELKDGRTIERYSAPMLGADGRYYGRVWYFRDITERKAAEVALRRSEEEFRSLIEHAPLGIYRATPDGRILTANPAFIRMLGYRWVEELERLDMAGDLYAVAEQRDQLRAQLESADEATAEVEWKRRDGTTITVRLNGHTVRGPDGAIECYEGLVEDITQQRSLEGQFRQAQRLEAVGRLAGGVAHDFNNILTAISGYTDMLLDDANPGDPRRQDLEEIRTAAQRAAGLTRQLLAFSRKQVLQTRVLDLNAVVQTLEKMLRRLIGEDIALVFTPGADLGAVRADPGQLEQVILNLAVNSRDAMPEGGKLTIETANITLDESYVREHTGAAPGRYVLLAVSDTGIGMDEETRSHMFEPFFTTKEQGKGTGLGLATVYGIVKQSGGYVWVYSEPGRGATFKIYLPRVDEPVDGEESVSGLPEVAGGGETVLLAEDDAGVRQVVAEVLTQKGYRVLRADDGQTALALARENREAVRLLITDIVMPGMPGRELAGLVVALCPGVRVLFMSGYTDDAVVRHGVLQEGTPYLQKPFTPRALALKVRDVLDRGPR
jgi:two-component system cell cycle sensor histidine kinase/response regulator CckA